MTFNPALPAYSSKLALSPGYIQTNWMALEDVVSTSSLSTNTPLIPTDNVSAMYFYANVAPAGWTLVSPPIDCLLAIKGGSSAYNVTGGQVVGTWNGPAYELTQANLQGFGVGGTDTYISQFPDDTTYSNTPPTAHSHDWVSTRPTAAIGVLCTKNP